MSPFSKDETGNGSLSHSKDCSSLNKILVDGSITAVAYTSDILMTFTETNRKMEYIWWRYSFKCKYWIIYKISRFYLWTFKRGDWWQAFITSHIMNLIICLTIVFILCIWKRIFLSQCYFELSDIAQASDRTRASTASTSTFTGTDKKVLGTE